MSTSVQSYRHNPTIYVELIGNALYTPYVLRYAPAEERYKHIVQRLIGMPELIRQAEQNLSDAPEIWNKVAREENTGNIDLIDGVLARRLPKALAHEYDAGRGTALMALTRLQSALLEGTLGEENLATGASARWRTRRSSATCWRPVRRRRRC